MLKIVYNIGLCMFGANYFKHVGLAIRFDSQSALVIH